MCHIMYKKTFTKNDLTKRIKSLGLNLKVILSNSSHSYIKTYKDSRNNLEIKNILGKEGSLEIGEYTYGSINLQAYSNKFYISIGSYSSISEITILIGGNHHSDISTFPFKTLFMKYPIESDNFAPKGIKIGHDVWIGYGSIILDGSNIGTGAIIGAGTVIRGNIPPYSVVIGNPGTIIKYRFNEEEIKMLLSSEWWTLSKENLLKINHLLYSKDVKTFVSKVKQLRDAV